MEWLTPFADPDACPRIGGWHRDGPITQTTTKGVGQGRDQPRVPLPLWIQYLPGEVSPSP